MPREGEPLFASCSRTPQAPFRPETTTPRMRGRLGRALAELCELEERELKREQTAARRQNGVDVVDEVDVAQDGVPQALRAHATEAFGRHEPHQTALIGRTICRLVLK